SCHSSLRKRRRVKRQTPTTTGWTQSCSLTSPTSHFLFGIITLNSLSPPCLYTGMTSGLSSTSSTGSFSSDHYLFRIRGSYRGCLLMALQAPFNFTHHD